MSTLELVKAEELVAMWLTGDGDNPAGPLFTGGEHTEADITMTGPGQSGRCGTACSGSAKYQCC
jgi:Family of unknown function (DUF6229)